MGKVGVISRAPPGVRSRVSRTILHNGGTVGLLKASVCHEFPVYEGVCVCGCGCGCMCVLNFLAYVGHTHFFKTHVTLTVARMGSQYKTTAMEKHQVKKIRGLMMLMMVVMKMMMLTRGPIRHSF